MIGAPLNGFLSKFMGKGMAAGLTLTVFALFILLMMRILIPPLVDQARNLAGLDYEKIISGLEEPISDVKGWLEDKGLISPHIPMPNETEVEDESDLRTTVVRLDSLLKVQGDTLTDTGVDLVINVSTPPDNVTPETSNNSDDLLLGVKNNIFDLFNPAQIPKLLGSFVGFFGNILVTLLSVFFIAFFLSLIHI